MKFTVGYIKNGEKFLFLYRNKKENDLNKGKYIGVGGHIEDGETSDECMIRETYEETGLKIKAMKLLGKVFYEDISGIKEDMYVYYIDGYEGKLTECDEGELLFMTEEEFLKSPHWIGDEIFIKYVFRGKEFGNLYLKYDKDKLLEIKSDSGN